MHQLSFLLQLQLTLLNHFLYFNFNCKLNVVYPMHREHRYIHRTEPDILTCLQCLQMQFQTFFLSQGFLYHWMVMQLESRATLENCPWWNLWHPRVWHIGWWKALESCFVVNIHVVKRKMLQFFCHAGCYSSSSFLHSVLQICPDVCSCTVLTGSCDQVMSWKPLFTVKAYFLPLSPKFWKEGAKCVSALCPWQRVTKPGMHRKEVTEARLSVLAPFLYFPPLLFPAPSLPDKGEKGWWSKRNKYRAPGWGSVHMSAHVCVHVCCGRVKRFRGGGLPSRAVSHHGVDPPGSFRCPSGFIILLSG